MPSYRTTVRHCILLLNGVEQVQTTSNMCKAQTIIDNYRNKLRELKLSNNDWVLEMKRNCLIFPAPMIQSELFVQFVHGEANV